ncbi:DNA-directed RNA polymerase III subunit RPC8 isoform X1 [Odontomachus brunneus]|uniref:DNA-directed RNA polymerase III subunit RPC8 isoform X1 n=1 Tax=Odontomachus brunneus TaxID=486640 RepID=UPI0013F27DD3|nr:DNA-directed RNA polymerase III subunit RPC8 isoform X1 [Odontomachus brunneus]XP_032688883.1 DNA-directed RNA polymerase III subunit RPC8 isoform X1 [Odontomachus brunneus]XP_032688885.1 DNA-directed RNA polymerase III subunit RPC8 isoform X1 [Odontomachus brunneus]
MFILADLKDTVRTPPSNFKQKLNDMIAEELNRKLVNKVYINVGLCIILYDITKIEESHIFPGDGASHTSVSFRFVVFRPFMEEILIGKIRSCSIDGIYVTLGFFEDIIIPPHKLQHPSRFDQMDQVWVWEYKTADGEIHDLFMDADELIRFRIVDEFFTEELPKPPDAAEKQETNKTPPYILHVSKTEYFIILINFKTQCI